ncbi:family 20 glycosylhydrolase [Microbacterium ulmi]|uniref:beta-N-acetylhexosaminidase n=1 Tax=Microbacterium ulmi TaxID=179095 RepID=A0A7Y2Q2X5_9MICO|nr:family 20 glycosylhydrolase [Microbacterium ulmi]NII68876.1 hexosaminidase [Microbacterium ulmi]NNH05128.1 family 20 glycosylhydrolase [Microbacterium ulmi]
MTSTAIVPAVAGASGGSGDCPFLFTAATPVVAASDALTSVVRRFVDDLRRDTGLEPAPEPGAPAVRVRLGADGIETVGIAAGVRADGAAVDGPGDERHALSITADGIEVWGPTPEAVHRGLTTLRQLVATQLRGATAELAAARLVDGPRFAWRGLSLDVVRTFHDVDTVQRVIDMCALYKLNVLHLHLTDDQGWRIEVPARPALTEVGARGAGGDRPGGFYSLADMAGLDAYAAERFVTIVPEIDMPGHASAAIRSYPGLAPAGVVPSDVEGLAVAGGLLDPSRDDVWAFVEDVLDGVLPQFPRSAYVHLGGDEAFGMPSSAHIAFVEQAAALVRGRGKKVVGWQEAARAEVDAETVVQHWIDIPAAAAESLRGRVPNAFLDILIDNLRAAVDDVPRALARGARVLLSPSARLYLDRPHGDDSVDPAQNAVRARLGMPVYPPARLRDGVAWDVVADVAHIESDDQVAGVEAAVWCETVTSRSDLELLLLPRLPGAAERAWSARPTEWDEYRHRLAAQATLWEHRGWEWYQADSVAWPVLTP